MFLSEDKEYEVVLKDCIEEMETMPKASVDFAVFSPPFPSVFSYTSLPEDIGNSEDLRGDAPLHLSFFFRALSGIVKPGRIIVVHLTQIGKRKRDGEQGIYDFRGLVIRLAERAGLIFDYDWVIRRNPQSQAIRTKKWELKFQGLEADRAQSRGSMSDYILKFRSPGKNLVPVDSKGQVSRNEWIEWAEPVWMDIKETYTLNKSEGRAENDTKHISPLQLGVIERLIRMYSNPDEIVFSPFAGIGSELFMALKLGRRAFGCEIKPEYHAAAIKNCNRAIASREENQKSLLSVMEAAESSQH